MDCCLNSEIENPAVKPIVLTVSLNKYVECTRKLIGVHMSIIVLWDSGSY